MGLNPGCVLKSFLLDMKNRKCSFFFQKKLSKHARLLGSSEYVSTYRGRIKDGNTRYHETLAEIFRLHFPIWEKRFTLHYPEWPYFFNYTFVAGM